MGKSIVGSPLLSLPVRVFFYTIRSSQTDMIFTTLKFYSIRFVPACCVNLKKKKERSIHQMLAATLQLQGRFLRPISVNISRRKKI